MLKDDSDHSMNRDFTLWKNDSLWTSCSGVGNFSSESDHARIRTAHQTSRVGRGTVPHNDESSVRCRSWQCLGQCKGIDGRGKPKIRPSEIIDYRVVQYLWIEVFRSTLGFTERAVLSESGEIGTNEDIKWGKTSRRKRAQRLGRGLIA